MLLLWQHKADHLGLFIFSGEIHLDDFVVDLKVGVEEYSYKKKLWYNYNKVSNS